MPGRPHPPLNVWHRMLEARLSRRTALGRGIAAAAGSGLALLPMRLEATDDAPAGAGAGAAGGAADGDCPFRPIKPSTADELGLPDGYHYERLRAYGDDIGRGQTFGYNNDFIAFLPIDLLEGGESSADGLLVVNHEYPNALLQHGNVKAPKTPEQIRTERGSLGMSVLRVTRGAGGKWACPPDDRNRRVDGYTECEITWPAAFGADGAALPRKVSGSVGNCSGGVTPWGTVLSCEENVDEFADSVADKGAGWDESYRKAHYGWVVELDPFDPKSTPKKRAAMGRFRHENVAVLVRPADGRVVAYMGDDKRDACLYKFVSAKPVDPVDRAANMDLLRDGQLYAADFANGKWVLLDYDAQPALRAAKRKDDGEAMFAGQADVLADARAAAMALKATPLDRPEDIEIHPRTGEVYVALTNNDTHGNLHGQIVRLREDGADATSFAWDFFAHGGPQSGFSSPDNLVFDPDGNLWMVTDVSSKVAGRKGIYEFQGNNAMFFFRTEGPHAGKARQFASGPFECELTGPCWTPDGTTMFLSVQHPGEETKDPGKPTSNWPDGQGKVPRPGVVAITGFAPFKRPHRPFHAEKGWAVGAQAARGASAGAAGRGGA